jgi:RNA-directed DNA polymerase
MARTAEQDQVRELQRTLYRAAKADPGRRFHALYDKVFRSDVLEQAWRQVRANRGAAGIDRATIADVEQHGVERLLDELAADLKERRWRPLPARRVFIAKPGKLEQRPLSIPTVRDRVVQTALKLAIEPVFEADMLECSFGFRPRRSAHDALQVLVDEAWAGRRWVVETDIASYFESIPHDRLMEAIEERVADRRVLGLLRVMLRAGVMQDGTLTRSDTGTPQGGVISPLLANVYLGRLDRSWKVSGHGVLVRYADDLVVMCKTKAQAEAALQQLRVIAAELGLSLKDAKTRIVHLREGGEGIDFLGFHHRWVRARGQRFSHFCFLARWPSRQGMQHARDQLRVLTERRRLRLPVDLIVRDINMFLRGWSGYYRYGNSADYFNKVNHFAVERLALFVAKRHKRRRRYGQNMVWRVSTDRLGLIDINGTVVPPRPNKPWRGNSRMPTVKNVGEPCAGEPHARFEAAAGGNQR